jgi:hypothetical protein
MGKIVEKEWVKDFQEFVQNEGTAVPEEISSSILSRVRRDLNPSAWIVFAKLLGIHSVVGTLSLAICSQFGIDPFHTGFSLSEFFMELGHSVCMALCGVLFVTLSIVAARQFIQPEELRVLRKNAWLEIFGLSSISLGVFAALGAEITLLIGAVWLAGATIGGVTAVMIPQQKLREA